MINRDTKYLVLETLRFKKPVGWAEETRADKKSWMV